MNIRVLGPGCRNCETLEHNVRQAAQKNGWDVQIEKVTDMAEIAGYGVMRTPGLMFGDEVVSVGRVLSPQQIEELWARRG